MTDELIKFAVVGYGHIGKRHADMVIANKDCKLQVVIDSNLHVEAELKDLEGVHFFKSLDDFLGAEVDVDVVNIATPNALHAEQAIACLTAGYHVVIEKPMALSVSDCKEILDYAQTNHKHVFGVMQNRYSKPMKWLKGLLTEEVLGDIYMVDVHCYWNRNDKYYTSSNWHGSADIDGGTLYTQFSHYVDLLFWLFGGMEKFSGRFANYNHKEVIDFEDTGHINFDFEQGGQGSLSYTTAVWEKNMESTMVVIAEKGTVKIGGQYMDKIEYCHVDGYTLEEDVSKTDAVVVGNYKGAKANHSYVIDNVVNVLKGISEDITTNANEGLRVVEIIEQIYSLKP